MMKLTVSFGETKVVVPCGSGEFSVRELAFNAIKRVKHLFPKLESHKRFVINNLSIAKDGGILDWDDLVKDVLDDREQVTVHYCIASLPDGSESTTRDNQHLHYCCSPLVVELFSDSGAGGSSQSGPQSNEASGSGESGIAFGQSLANQCEVLDRPPPVAQAIDENNSSESNLSLSMSALSFGASNDQIESINKPECCSVRGRSPNMEQHGRTERAYTHIEPSENSTVAMAYSPIISDEQIKSTDPFSPHTYKSLSKSVVADIWHPVFSSNASKMFLPVSSRRRDCIDMNWDADEEEEDSANNCMENGGQPIKCDSCLQELTSINQRCSGDLIISTNQTSSSSEHQACSSEPNCSNICDVHKPVALEHERKSLVFWPPPPSSVLDLVNTDSKKELENVYDHLDTSQRGALTKTSTGTFSAIEEDDDRERICSASFAASRTNCDIDSLLRLVLSSISSSHNVVNRSMFSKLVVPPIMEEEEEEVSVDYDQSTVTTPVQISDCPTSGNLMASSTSLTQMQEGVDEDYPMLRQDYFVSPDRSEKQSLTNQICSDLTSSANEQSDTCKFTSSPIENDNTLTFQHITRGLSTPAVLRWLESTQSAGAFGTSSGMFVSDSGSSSAISPSSVQDASNYDEGACEKGEKESAHSTPYETIRIRLPNVKIGEQLGIQIKPAFIDSTKIKSRDPNQLNITDRIDFGLEVHHVVPEGRISKENCLSVGDRILSINGVCLIGLPFERSRDLFQAALTQPELVLDVLPCSSHLQRNRVADAAMTTESSSVEPVAQTRKLAPPPPPRRSPNTMLTRVSTGYHSTSTGQNPHLHLSNNNLPDEANYLTGPSSLNDLPAVESSVNAKKSQYIHIELHKGSSGLGFSLTSRDVPPTNERMTFVKSILPNGAALTDGRLRPNDRLVQVDGHQVAHLGQARTVALLREKPVGSIVELLVCRTTEGSTNPKEVTKFDQIKSGEISVGKCEEITESNVDVTKTNLSQFYKLYNINPSHYSISELYISLPCTESTNNETGDEVKPTQPPPVTLGVSVSIRPWLPPERKRSQPHEYLDNAVFVRSLIEGGLAHRDGRLQIGDRLLSIDGEVLSGLRNQDALQRLKGIIFRDLREKHSHVQLLIARPISRYYREKEQRGTDKVETNGTLVASTNHRDTPTSDTVPVPVKTSMVVSAEVHTVEATHTPADTTLHPAQLSIANQTKSRDLVQSTQTTSTATVHRQRSKIHSHSGHSRKKPDARKERERNRINNMCHTHRQTVYRAPSSVTQPPARTVSKLVQTTISTSHTEEESTVDKGSLSNPFKPPASSVSSESSSPTRTPLDASVTFNSVTVLSDDLDRRDDKIYRCNSQGTLSSTDLSDCNFSLLSAIGCRKEGSVCSDPETDRYSLSHTKFGTRPASHEKSTGLSSSGCPHRSARVVVQQPRIDLSQMVLIPFDPNSWTGPVLKPKSMLSPEELTRVVCSSSDQEKKVEPFHSAHITGNKEEMTTQNHSGFKHPTSELDCAGYQSDSGTSRKDSLSSTSVSFDKTGSKKIFQKLFHSLVRSNTSRPSTVAQSLVSAYTQTDSSSIELASPERFVANPSKILNPEHSPRISTGLMSRTNKATFSTTFSNTTTENASLDQRVRSPYHMCPFAEANHVRRQERIIRFPERVVHSPNCPYFQGANPHCPVHQNRHFVVQNLYSTAAPFWKAPTLQPSDRLLYINPDQMLLNSLNHSKHSRPENRGDHPLSTTKSTNVSVPPENGIRHSCNPTHDLKKTGSVNRTFDPDGSSCSTVYESVVEFMEPAEARTEEKTGRDVYEDAETLYRYLASMKNTGDEDASEVSKSSNSFKTDFGLKTNCDVFPLMYM